MKSVRLPCRIRYEKSAFIVQTSSSPMSFFRILRHSDWEPRQPMTFMHETEAPSTKKYLWRNFRKGIFHIVQKFSRKSMEIFWDTDTCIATTDSKKLALKTLEGKPFWISCIFHRKPKYGDTSNYLLLAKSIRKHAWWYRELVRRFSRFCCCISDSNYSRFFLQTFREIPDSFSNANQATFQDE